MPLKEFLTPYRQYICVVLIAHTIFQDALYDVMHPNTGNSGTLDNKIVDSFPDQT
jgi:hypothetical protein